MTYIYIHYSPSPPLNTYIEDLYYHKGPIPFPHEKMLPMPSLEMLINLGDPIKVHDAECAGPSVTCAESWCVGLWSRYYIVTWPLNLEFFGIRFKPAGAYQFLKHPLSELHNQVVSLDAIWGHYADEIRQQLYAKPTISARFAVLEQLLLARLREAPYGLDVVQFATAEITRQHGAISIQALSDQIGVSQKHLGTLFKRMVGMPPKKLAQLYRLAHIHRSIDPTRPVDWASLAQQAGYSDQSHLNKDFMAFIGHNPTDYLQLRRQLHNMDPEHHQLLRPLPVG